MKKMNFAFFAIVLALTVLSSASFAQELITGGKKKFVPGNKVIYEETFKTCPVGEMPEGWNKTTGDIECVRYRDLIWITPSVKCTEDHEAAIYKKLNIGKSEFSLEYDVIPLKDHAHLKLRLLKKQREKWDQARFSYDLGFYGIRWDKACTVNLENTGEIATIRDCPKKKIHIAIQVRRRQYRVYVNGERSIMKPFNGEVSGFEIRFPADTEKYAVLVSNIKIAKYTEAEEKPTPEKLGIKVEKTKEGLKLTVPEKVLFDFNKFYLKPEARKALKVVAEIIRENPNAKVRVIGYTDNIGSKEYNLRLSLQRAQSVADYLMYVENISCGKITIEGKGKANPIADNSTEEGRAKNRRVEIKILK